MTKPSEPAANASKPIIGLALGGGAARGWAHLGIIRELENLGVTPDVVCGTSIGALVGATYVSGKIDAFEQWVLTLTRKDVVSMLDVHFRSGLIRGDRVVQYCKEHFFVPDFSETDKPFACVATELSTGREVWLREGAIADAVRASIALPGLFSPTKYKNKILVDGGLVNPVPVSLCRALGAEFVIAVDLSAGIVRRNFGKENNAAIESSGLFDKMRGAIGWQSEKPPETQAEILPSLLEVVINSINIMQVGIAKSRQAGDPPEILIAPQIGHITAMEFERAQEGIAEGRAAVARIADTLCNALGNH